MSGYIYIINRNICSGFAHQKRDPWFGEKVWGGGWTVKSNEVAHLDPHIPFPAQNCRDGTTQVLVSLLTLFFYKSRRPSMDNWRATTSWLIWSWLRWSALDQTIGPLNLHLDCGGLYGDQDSRGCGWRRQTLLVHWRGYTCFKRVKTEIELRRF